MLRQLAFSILTVGFLSACATVTPYAPAGSDGGYGFADQKLETNKFRVSFSGNSSTSRQAVENYLLYRAAELTRQTGNDYFVIIEDDTEIHKSYSVSSTFPRYGRRDYLIGRRKHHYSYPYYSYGFEWGGRYDQQVHEFTRYSAEAYITMHKGSKPSADNAFVASEVIENLAPFIAKTSKS